VRAPFDGWSGAARAGRLHHREGSAPQIDAATLQVSSRSARMDPRARGRARRVHVSPYRRSLPARSSTSRPRSSPPRAA
jgi:hypothetical protein